MARTRQGKTSLSRGMMLVFYGLLLLQSSALLVILFGTADSQEDAVYQAMRNTNAQVLNYIDASVQEAEDYDRFYLLDHRFSQIMNSDYMARGSGEYAQAQVYVKGLMRKHIAMAPNVIGVTIATASGQIYDITGGDSAYLATLEGFRAAMDASGQKSRLISPLEISIHRQKHWGMILTHRLIDLYSQRTMGYIHYTLSLPRLMDHLLRQSGDSGYSLTTMLLSNGQLLYSNHDLVLPEAVRRNAPSRQAEEIRCIFHTESKESYILLSTYAPRYGLELVQCEAYGILTNSIWEASLLVVLVNGCVLIVCFITTIRFGRAVQRDIRQIESSLRNGQSNREIQQPLRFQELNTLFEAWQNAKVELRTVQEHEKQILAQKMEMEMRYLEAQINPHFICNSLNLISSLAQLENNTSISDMATNLAHLLYYNLKGTRIIAVREEIQQVRRYIAIQQMRFPDRFTIAIDLPEALMDCSICRFALQPIVENAMVHGLEQACGHLRLTITGAIEGQQCTITVENNGLPLTDRRIAEINAMLQCDAEEALTATGGGLGLMNVASRLRREGGVYGWVRLEKRSDGQGLRAVVGFRYSPLEEASHGHPNC